MNLNLKMTVERSKRRSYFLSLIFITKCFNSKSRTINPDGLNIGEETLIMPRFYVFRLIIFFITYGAKLLNADWLRQRSFFLNHEGTFDNQEGMIT